ncbi:MAG: KTSC domain-containing protein [Flavobacteriales bacterium]
MKRISAYKKLFNVEKEIELKPLKKAYRNLVKEWHPDRFQDGDAQAEIAEEKSREITNGYHFLISIAPETKEKQLEEYTKTISECGIADFFHKGQLLEITFTDGSTYEYFGVPRPIYVKMVNADKIVRFAKRNIYTSYLYRKSKKEMQEA